MNDMTRNWAALLAPYKTPDNRRAVMEIVVTVASYAATWFAAYWLLRYSWFAALPLIVINAFMLVRVFALQHDCGHGGMFSSQTANDWAGRIFGVFTLTPYSYWRHTHAIHHASSGNLERRGIGDINTLTVEEYRAMGRWGKLAYRLYRNPLVLFGIGPAYMFLFKQRIPAELMNRGWKPWVSAMGTNVSIILLIFGIYWFTGWDGLLKVHLPSVMIAGTIGVWLFYVQHQFDPTHWDKGKDWHRENAALHGSSFYDLPAPLMWATGHIGIHHVHHLSSSIPFHRLPQVLRDFPEMRKMGRLTFSRSLTCIPLALWDEKTRQLISFRQYYRNEAITA